MRSGRLRPLVAFGISAIAVLALSSCARHEVVQGTNLASARWLVIGPFAVAGTEGPSGTRAGVERDFLSSLGGEAAARPERGDIVDARSWTEVVALDGKVDLLRCYPGTTNAVAYAYTEFEAKQPGAVALKLGSDDGISVWLNGNRVWTNPILRSLTPAADAVRVDLAAGRNRLLVKLDQASGNWGFSASIRSIDEEAGDWSRLPGRSLRIVLRRSLCSAASEAECTVSTDPGYAVEIPVELSVSDSTGMLVGTASATTGRQTTVPLPLDAVGVYTIQVACTFPGIAAADAIILVGDQQKLVAEAVTKARATLAKAEPAVSTLAFLADHLEGKGPAPLHSADRDLRAMLTIDRITAAVASGTFKPENFTGQHQWAYRSAIDGSYQPYTVYLPKNYNSATEYGLVFALHGHTDNDWNAASNLSRSQPEGVIIAAPYGRGDIGYRTIGEQDVLDVLRLVEETYSIDRNRIYLVGWSMGGMGTWRIAQEYTDLFAAVAPFCGWTGTGYLCNLMNTPTLIVHGDADPTVSPTLDRTAAAKLGQLGAPVEYRELKGVDHDTWSPAVLAAAGIDVLSYFDSHVKNDWPAKLTVAVADPRYGRHFWVRVDELTSPPLVGRIDAEIVDETLVGVKTEKIGAFALDLRHPSLTSHGAIVVNIDNDSMVVAGGTPAACFVRGADERWSFTTPPDPALARHEGAGWAGVFLGPLTIVYGTQDPDRAPILRLAAQSIADWAAGPQIPVGSTIGEFKIRSDLEVTEQDLESGNLLLIGGESENRLSKAQLDFMNVHIHGDSVTVAGREIPGQGLVAVYPNIRSTSRLATVLVIPRATIDVGGLLYYAAIGLHSFSVNSAATDPVLFPDLEVFSSLQSLFGGAASWAGYYDRNWKNLGRTR